MKIPEIGENGQAQSPQDFDIHHCDSNEILTRSHPLPDYLLLNFKQKTISDKLMRICISSLCYLLIASVFCLFVILLLPKLLAYGLSLIILIATFFITAWTEYQKPNLWQRAEWLDFKTRDRLSCVKYFDGSLPTTTKYMPLDNLILVCSGEVLGEDYEITYRVALCEGSELVNLRAGRTPSTLNILQYTKTEEEAVIFTKELAQLWKIPAWRGYEKGIAATPHVQKLHVPNKPL